MVTSPAMAQVVLWPRSKMLVMEMAKDRQAATAKDRQVVTAKDRQVATAKDRQVAMVQVAPLPRSKALDMAVAKDQQMDFPRTMATRRPLPVPPHSAKVKVPIIATVIISTRLRPVT